MAIELVPHKFQGPDLRCPELFHPNNVQQVEKELHKSWRITWYIANWTLRICYIFFNRANQIDSHIKKWNKQITQLEGRLDVEAVGKGKDRETQAKITELFEDYRVKLEILRKELDAVKKCPSDEAKMRVRPWIYRRWVWLVEQNLDGVAKNVGTFKKSETVEIGTHRMVFVDLHNKLKEEFEKLNGQLNPEVEKHLPKTFFDTWKELASHLTNKKPPMLGKLEEWKREVRDHIDSKVLELQTTLTVIQTGLQNQHAFFALIDEKKGHKFLTGKTVPEIITLAIEEFRANLEARREQGKKGEIELMTDVWFQQKKSDIDTLISSTDYALTTHFTKIENLLRESKMRCAELEKVPLKGLYANDEIRFKRLQAKLQKADLDITQIEGWCQRREALIKKVKEELAGIDKRRQVFSDWQRACAQALPNKDHQFPEPIKAQVEQEKAEIEKLQKKGYGVGNKIGIDAWLQKKQRQLGIPRKRIAEAQAIDKSAYETAHKEMKEWIVSLREEITTLQALQEPNATRDLGREKQDQLDKWKPFSANWHPSELKQVDDLIKQIELLRRVQAFLRDHKNDFNGEFKEAADRALSKVNALRDISRDFDKHDAVFAEAEKLFTQAQAFNADAKDLENSRKERDQLIDALAKLKDPKEADLQPLKQRFDALKLKCQQWDPIWLSLDLLEQQISSLKPQAEFNSLCKAIEEKQRILNEKPVKDITDADLEDKDIGLKYGAIESSLTLAQKEQYSKLYTALAIKISTIKSQQHEMDDVFQKKLEVTFEVRKSKDDGNCLFDSLIQQKELFKTHPWAQCGDAASLRKAFYTHLAEHGNNDDFINSQLTSLKLDFSSLEDDEARKEFLSRYPPLMRKALEGSDETYTLKDYAEEMKDTKFYPDAYEVGPIAVFLNVKIAIQSLKYTNKSNSITLDGKGENTLYLYRPKEQAHYMPMFPRNS